MAATVFDELPQNTVTRSYFLRGVRMATLCAAGKHGVQFASDGARARRAASGLHWDKCGLVKEHVVPVSVICALVRQELGVKDEGVRIAESLALLEEAADLSPKVVALFQGNPRAWQIASLIRAWTLLAWITAEEDRKFDEKDSLGGISLRQRMPKEWNADADRLARYHACGIPLYRI